MFRFTNQKRDKILESTFTCQRDSLIIRGTEYRAEGENLPIAIVSHGFMASQDTVRRYAKKIAGLGYAAYCFDFCGGCVANGKSDGKTTEMSVMTEVKDLEAVIDYAKGRPYVNPQRIVLMGCSQGGFVSAITASRLKGQISKLILFYPALCIPNDAKAGKMMFARFDPHHIPEFIQCGPMKLGKCYVEDVIDLDPYQEIKEFPGDILIVHGKSDRIVDLKYSKQAYLTYMEETKRKKLTRKVLFYRIKNGRHGFTKKHDAIAMIYLEHFLTRTGKGTERNLHEKFEFRNIRSDEAEQAAEIEQICFPPNEACSRKSMYERVEKAPEFFWRQWTGIRAKWPDF